MSSALARTGTELRRAAGDARAAWSLRAALAVALFLVAAILPPATGLFGALDSLAGGLYLGLAAVGVAFAVGIGGIPLLAQGAFMGVGAFVAALLRIHLSVPLGPAAVLGAVAASAAGVAVGLGTVRLRPALIAVGTWLCSWLALLALQAFPSVFGGSDGLALPPALSTLGHYELALALVALAALAYVALARGPTGTRLRAAHDRPAAAAAAGVPTARLRVQAFAFAAALGGLAGGLSVDLLGVADPSGYGPGLSFKLFVAVLIAGASSALAGPVGIGLLGLVTLLARDAAGFSDQLSARFQTVTATVIVLLLLPESEGLLPALEERLPGRAPRRPGRVPPLALEPRGEPVSLRAEGLTKRYGAVAALDGLDLLLEPGTVHALVGPNGSGKTTALRALAGTLAPDEGRVLLGGEDVTAEPVERRVELGIARTLQATAVFGPLTALESVLVGVTGRRRFADLGRTLLATPQHRAESEAARIAALEALDAVGLAGRADERADLLTATEQRLLMIATAVATAPRVLLLDEPAAGIGPAELPRLAAAVASLRDRGLGLLVVEHNLRLVRTIADRVTVLDAGRAIAAGLPDEVGRDPAVRAAYLGRHSI